MGRLALGGGVEWSADPALMLDPSPIPGLVYWVLRFAPAVSLVQI